MDEPDVPRIGRSCPYCGSRVRPREVLLSKTVTCSVCSGRSNVVGRASLVLVWVLILLAASGVHLGLLENASLLRFLLDVLVVAAGASLVWLATVRLKPVHLS